MDATPAGRDGTDTDPCPPIVASSSMNASVTKPFTELPTDRQKPNGMPGSVSVYSTRRFGMAYGRLAAPSTEIASTPFDPASAFGFSFLSSDCWTMRCFQTRRVARRVDGAPHAHVGDWPVDVVLRVVLARPDDLDRRAHRLRRFHGVGDEVAFRAPAESAADIGRVHEDLGLGQTRGGHRRLLRRRLRLRRHPHVAPIGLHVRRAVHRLHRRVRQERRFEDPLDLLRRIRGRPACASALPSLRATAPGCCRELHVAAP